MLQQVVGGLDEVPEKIVKAFREREKVIGGQRLPLAEIVEFLQDISSSRSTFICIDALDQSFRTSGEASRFTQQNSSEIPRRSAIYDWETTYPG